MKITTTLYRTGLPDVFYAIGEVDGKIYTAIETTRNGAFMAVAWQLAVAGYIKQ